MAARDRGQQLRGNPSMHRFRVQARDRSEAVVVARDRAWEQGLFVVGDAQVTAIRRRAEGHEFLVALPCLEQE
jgi:hypothetical protein